MPALDKRELQKILEQMMEVLAKNNLLPAGTNKNAVASTVAHKLEKYEIQSEDLDLQHHFDKANAMRDTLILALMAESSQIQDPEKRFDYEKLFKPRGPAHLEEMKKEMKKELLKMFTLINNKLEPSKQKTSAQLEAEVDKFINDFSKKFMDEDEQNALAQNRNMANLFTAAMMSVSILYDGINLTYGGKTMIVQQIPEQNPNGYIDYNIGGGSASVMQDQNTAEPGKLDYKAKEAQTIWHALGKGGLSADLERQIELVETVNESRAWHIPSPRDLPTGKA